MPDSATDTDNSEQEYQEEEEVAMDIDEETASETSEDMGPYYEVNEKVFVVIKSVQKGKRKINQVIEPIQPARVLSVTTADSEDDGVEGRPVYLYVLQMYSDVSMKTKQKDTMTTEEINVIDMNKENLERFRVQLEHLNEEKHPGSKKSSKHESRSKHSSKESVSVSTYPNRLLPYKSETYMKRVASQARRQAKTFKQIVSLDDSSNDSFDTPTCMFKLVIFCLLTCFYQILASQLPLRYVLCVNIVTSQDLLVNIPILVPISVIITLNCIQY